jgi:hypothetical protein
MLSGVLTLSIAPPLNGGRFPGLSRFTQNYMGYFYLCFSIVKLMNPQAFANSFKDYDPIAKLFPVYGLAYPFLEFLLGISFIKNGHNIISNLITIIILLPQSTGVWLALKSGQRLNCACLGGSLFKIPLSMFTIGENVIMIAMALCNLIARK